MRKRLGEKATLALFCWSVIALVMGSTSPLTKLRLSFLRSVGISETLPAPIPAAAMILIFALRITVNRYRLIAVRQALERSLNHSSTLP
jgi:hypothetical protein